MGRTDRPHRASGRTPSTGRRMVRRLNIDGDGQGDLARARRRATARCSSTRSSPTATGRTCSAATTSPTGSSARTSPSKGSPTTRSASATATGSARRCSRSASRGSRATASASGWASRGCRRCSSPTAGPASTCGCSRRARSAPATRSNASSAARRRMTVAEIDAPALPPGPRAPDLSARCGSRR